MNLKPTIDIERYPYQMRLQDFYCDCCHDRSLFYYHSNYGNMSDLQKRKRGIKMSNEVLTKEVQEAIRAGERALNSLRTAQANLKSARGWGIWDMLGGGLITDMIKHSKISNAMNAIESAKWDLESFEKELRDVRAHVNLNIDIGGFLSFADFFFDGIIADYLVQTKIAEARHQVDEAIYRVESLLVDLRKII